MPKYYEIDFWEAPGDAEAFAEILSECIHEDLGEFVNVSVAPDDDGRDYEDLQRDIVIPAATMARAVKIQRERMVA